MLALRTCARIALRSVPTRLPVASARIVAAGLARAATSVAMSTAAAAPRGDFYADGKTFPVVPRTAGIATVTYGPKGKPASETTVVRLVSKDDLKGTSLAAADAEKDGVVVSYATVDGTEQRTIASSYGGKATLASVRKAVSAAVSKARGVKTTNIEIAALPAVAGVPAAAVAAAAVQAAALTNYAFDRYLTTESKVPHFLSAIHVAADAVPAGSDASAVEAAVARASLLAQGAIFARDLVNERADEMHPARLEEIAAAIAGEGGMELHTVVGDALVPAGLHLLHAVGQAARVAPRYIELFYPGDPSHPEDVIAIVGKGVVFDSGGLNIKGTGFMEDMHADMGGSAAVLGTAHVVKRLGIKRNIVFVVGAVENAIDSLAYKPHAIIRSHKGLTVEIGNTDAEGRLVLADALSYVQARRAPHTIIDLATLTGACVIALGEPIAGAFSNSKALRESIIAAGETVAEPFWPLPIFDEHRDQLKTTPFADLKSTGEGRYGGASTAAAFLENFIGGPIPAKNARDAAAGAAASGGAAAAPAAASSTGKKPTWAHLDIAGPAHYSKPRGHVTKGGTGFAVQTLLTYLEAAPAGAVPVDEE